MKKIPFLSCLMVALVAVSYVSAKVERTVSNRFDVQPGGTLTVDADVGAIQIATSDESAVVVEVRETIAVDNDKAADDVLKDLTLTIDQKGADVGIAARLLRSKVSWLGVRNSPLELTFVVKVPRRYHLSLKTSGGTIRVEDLKGNVNARTSGGSMKFAEIDGNIQGRTSGGGIEVEACTGAVDLRTSGGNLRLGKMDGPTEARTSGGSIHIDEAGDIFNVHTSGGSIHVEIAGSLKGDCEAGTSGGGIEVEIVRSASFNIDARTSGGVVKVDFPVATDPGATDKHSVAGKVNAGGPIVKLRTSGGGIRVSAR